MIYSVWDHGARRYAYYQTPEMADAVNAPSPKHLSEGDDPLGLVPEEAAWPLPANATPVGFGKIAKGKIASSESLGNGRGPFLFFGLGVALAYFWR